jgi:eukaryotic-like serine/threonine-protein kinase
MELVQGVTLRNELGRSGPLPLPRLVRLGLQLCAALDVAHAAGIVHRDIKPENVLLEQDPVAGEQVKLTDFGIAKEPRGQHTSWATTEGVALGTPLFMAPEQSRGEVTLDLRVDIYALGVLFYFASTGQVPFDGSNFTEVAERAANTTPPSVRALRPELPEEFAALVAIAMAREPACRFQSCSAVARALSSLDTG